MLRTVFLVAVYAFLLSVSPASAAPQPAATTTVRLSPASLEARVGEPFTLDVVVENVAGLSCADVRLTYDPAALAVQDADPFSDGAQIAPGPFLSADVMRVNEVAGGVIHYGVEQASVSDPVSGSGVIATITFVALQSTHPTVAFDVSASFLCDVAGAELPVSAWSGATIDGTSEAHLTLIGKVFREAWPVHDQTTVSLTIGVGRYRRMWQTVTARDGSFRIDVPVCSLPIVYAPESSEPALSPPVSCLPPNLYGWRADIRATFPNYLSAYMPLDFNRLRPLGSTIDLGATTLLAGDANGDDAVNVSDLALIGSHFGRSVQPPCGVVVDGQSAPPADINGDCRVNIIDVILLIRNYGRVGPLPWGTVSTLSSTPN